jgi:glucose/arabinose dehydrogenase
MKTRVNRIALSITLAACMTAGLANSAFAAETSAVPTTEISTTPAPASPAEQPTPDSARYASREQTAKELQNFRGGEGVSLYIGGSALAIALVLVLAIVIL